MLEPLCPIPHPAGRVADPGVTIGYRQKESCGCLRVIIQGVLMGGTLASALVGASQADRDHLGQAKVSAP